MRNYCVCSAICSTKFVPNIDNTVLCGINTKKTAKMAVFLVFINWRVSFSVVYYNDISEY